MRRFSAAQVGPPTGQGPPPALHERHPLRRVRPFPLLSSFSSARTDPPPPSPLLLLLASPPSSTLARSRLHQIVTHNLLGPPPSSRRPHLAAPLRRPSPTRSAIPLFFYSAYLGGSLVYKYGMGVQRQGESAEVKDRQEKEE